MAKGYHHLTQGERYQIAALLASGMSMQSIAKQLGRRVGTISKEISRNGGESGYCPEQAQELSEERRRAASSKPWKMNPRMWRLVVLLLEIECSPEQISGFCRRIGYDMAGRTWIYEYIREDRRNGGTLYLLLRRRGRKRNWMKGKHAGRGHIPNRVGIENRPSVVERKSRIGDLEGDTIVGAGHKGGIVVIVDRRTKRVWLRLVPDLKSSTVCDAVIELLGPHADRLHTITFDNGKEFSEHGRITAAVGIPVYFARPYRSSDRGLVEHTNGMVREVFPKGTDFRQVSAADIQAVEDMINRRPRKSLKYDLPVWAFGG